MLDLSLRTHEVLDFTVLREALTQYARTPMGQRACQTLQPHRSIAAIHADFDAVDELSIYEIEEGPLPVGAIGDIGLLVDQASRGMVLDSGSLRLAGRTLVALRELATRLMEVSEQAPTLAGLGAGISIDGWIADELDRAFDPTGQLSAATYPELGELRKLILDLHESIRRTLDDLLYGDTLADVLQDQFVTQRGDRYVLPIKAHAKRWDIGIVHGTSGSGKTVFMEPNEVIALNNRLKIAEGELQAAEHRILTQLSTQLGRIAEPVAVALEVTTALDLACARLGLATVLKATRPIVQEQGVIQLIQARHPVLVLRGVPVVSNDLSVTPQKPVLVLTGPNTGGKTVALKTMGLCALLVRLGCFVPAELGSRVDRFESVVADIGDTQTIADDLSSFSGHLVVLRTMLEQASPNRLFLLDELCSGTDPAQGGALARAVLERLLEAGPRVVVTTHFVQLKGLANVDSRFALAAMEYRDGRPTYRVRHGTSGESHALDTALRLGLDATLITRARGLMSESERALQDALGALEGERTRAEIAVEQAASQIKQLAERERSLSAREDELRQRVKAIEEREAAKFLERLRQAEKAISAVVADLQRSPDHRKVESARSTLDALRELAPTAPMPEAPLALAVGDRVRIRSSGAIGEIQAVGTAIRVKMGGITAKVRPEDLERVDSPKPLQKPIVKITVEPKYTPPDLHESLRYGGNTLDLRGKRVEEAIDEADRFFDKMIRTGIDVAFILHGHGTGAMKEAIREWLPGHPRVRDWSPANVDQGGDAFTAVVFKQ